MFESKQSDEKCEFNDLKRRENVVVRNESKDPFCPDLAHAVWIGTLEVSGKWWTLRNPTMDLGVKKSKC